MPPPIPTPRPGLGTYPPPLPPPKLPPPRPGLGTYTPPLPPLKLPPPPIRGQLMGPLIPAPGGTWPMGPPLGMNADGGSTGGLGGGFGPSLNRGSVPRIPALGGCEVLLVVPS